MTQSARRALSALTALVMAGTLFVGAPAPVFAADPAATYYVAQSGSSAQEETPARKGTSCADPDFVGGDATPIAAAADLATDGDTIFICAGAGPYLIESTISLGAELLTLQGAGAGATILDGGGNTQILTSSGAITVSNLTFHDGQNNSFGGTGGAIYAATITVVSSTFTSNYAYAGGAIRATTATVTHSTFTSNDAAGNGAAIYATTVTVISSRFTSNTANYGGAIYAFGATTIINSTFTSNTASIGGAILAGDYFTVTSSTFTGNTASTGGAISASTVTTTSSTFTGNTASGGGAIHADTTATVTSSTFTGNTATNRGGAIDATAGTIARSRFIRNTSNQHGGAVYFWGATADDLRHLRRNTFTRNTAPAGGAITLGSCGPTYSRSQAARVEGSNRFFGNRATEQRRTNNVERSETACG